MRFLALLATVLPVWALACTAFKHTRDGRTLVGCNEDAWSINAQVRFVPGGKGEHGAIYFAHYNGSPLRIMTDQMGMNTAGLVFDGLVLAPGAVKRRSSLPWMETSDAVARAMRTCATVQEVATYLRTQDAGPLNGMLFFCDAGGEYLIVEPDTMFVGKDPWYALSNWRMSTCGDPATIPIPRLQVGLKVLSAGEGNDLDVATEALERMAVCRERMGEGTLFSALFDVEARMVHLYFYHDFSQAVVIDLEEELAKGPHTVEMASLFGPRPEFERLRDHLTPFHQRWLWWTLAGFAVLAVLVGLVCAVLFVVRALRLALRKPTPPLLRVVWLGLSCAVCVVITGVLLLQEGVFYFGLGDVEPFMGWLPLMLVALLMMHAWSSPRVPRWRLAAGALVVLPFLALLGYWGLLWP